MKKCILCKCVWRSSKENDCDCVDHKHKFKHSKRCINCHCVDIYDCYCMDHKHKLKPKVRIPPPQTKTNSESKKIETKTLDDEELNILRFRVRIKQIVTFCNRWKLTLSCVSIEKSTSQRSNHTWRYSWIRSEKYLFS